MITFQAHKEMLQLQARLMEAHERTRSLAPRISDLDSLDAQIQTEYEVLVGVANTWGSRSGVELRDVDTDTLRRLEVPALGHFDYMPKFALYIAEFVYGWRD